MEYKLGGGWGCHVSLRDIGNFHLLDLNKDLVRVYGHQPRKPKKGDTLRGEFKRSFMTFKFVEVEYCLDPSDMFFANVKCIGQELK